MNNCQKSVHQPNFQCAEVATDMFKHEVMLALSEPA